jgi:hypothetical protein
MEWLRRLRSRMLLVSLLGLAAGTALSCSSGDGIRRHQVRGQVLYNGQALKGAMVVLYPLGDYPAKLQKPVAYSDAEGRFVMSTDKPGDGVPLGQYAVTVECRERTYSGAEKVKGGNLLPAHYSKPETSGLRCEVKEGENELPLRLTDK